MTEFGGSGATSAWRLRAEALAGLGTWTLDLESGELLGNPTVRTLLDWPEDRTDPLLADYFDAVHPDDRPVLLQHWQRLRREGVEYDLEHRLLLAHSTVKYMRAVACAGRDDQGRVTVLHGITQDVTARRSAELATERQRDRSRAVLSSLAEGYLLAQDGVIVEVNEALCRLTGFDEAALLGGPIPFPFWPPDDGPGPEEQKSRLGSEGTASSRLEIVRADGTQLPVAVTATRLNADHAQVWVVIVRDITEQREHERRLEARAAADPLTGVLNSRAFREELAVACTAPQDGPVSLALLDIDHFKAINDEHGHAVGDQVLLAVVERLRLASAAAGSLARVGGEEFALLMRHTDCAAAQRVVEGALEALRRTPLPFAGTVTASAGVAQLLPGMDDDTLYRLADLRLYDAKAQGRDQVR